MPEMNSQKASSLSKRLGVLFARLGAVAAASVAGLYLIAVVARGVASGSIHTASKYSHATVNIQTSPVAFWLAVFHHLVISLFISYIAYLCFVAGGWLKKSKRIDAFVQKADSTLPDPKKPLPTWVSLVVLGCFFTFLLAMCAKASSH